MIKRFFDILLSVTGLIIFSPFILLIMIQTHYKLGSPIFFRQIRPGKDAKPFKIIKFRTMDIKTDKNGSNLPDVLRMNNFGTFLRSTSLDELPELWNVLKGEMSLVGPRPLLMEYLPLYSKEQFKRHIVKPGVTGWAQINGRNQLSWDDKFKLDLWYVNNQSFFLDFKIILITIKKVISRDGIIASGESTAKKFEGNIK